MLSQTSSISYHSSVEDLSLPDLVLPCDLSFTLPCRMVSESACPLAIFDLSRIAPVPPAMERVLQRLHFADSSGNEVDVDALPEEETRVADTEERPSCIGQEHEVTTVTPTSTSNDIAEDDAKTDPYKTTPQFFSSQEKVNEWLESCSATTLPEESGLPGSFSSVADSDQHLIKCESDSAVFMEASVMNTCSHSLPVRRKAKSFLKTLRQASKNLRKRGGRKS
jgi:hypothetical protein